MEKAAEALKMTGAVLLFIIAISVSIASFSDVRQSVDTILEYKDRETEYVDGNYYYSQSSKDNERTVGLETILPTISRVYVENYKIIFEGLGSDPIYTVKKTGEKRYSLDGEFDNNIRGSGTEKEKSFLNAVVYGQGKSEPTFNTYSDKIILPGSSLYDRLKAILTNVSGKVIVEKSGRYYQDDEKNANDNGTSGDNNNRYYRGRTRSKQNEKKNYNICNTR